MEQGGGGPEDDGRWPPWLMPLLSMTFFVRCELHDGVRKSRRSCNMYCLDCMDGALCSTCLFDHHCGHRTIQIRKASRHDSVRVKEIEKFLDIGGVQPFVINGAKIVFLNERPMDGRGKGAANKCKVCDRGLLDPLPSVCSLGCQIAGTAAGYVRKNTLPKKKEKKNKNRKRKTMEAAADAEELPPPASVRSFRVKRRKGVPRRAPFGTLVLEH